MLVVFVLCNLPSAQSCSVPYSGRANWLAVQSFGLMSVPSEGCLVVRDDPSLGEGLSMPIK